MRRRKRKVSWLPTLGTRSDNGGVLNQTFSKIGDVVLPQDGTFTGTVIPLLYDQPASNLHDAPASKGLADFVGSEYILKRIVGKIFVYYLATNADAESPAGDGARGAMVTAGFFVARADANETLPIGFTSLTDFTNYDSDDPENAMEPWIWRRKWIIGSPGFTQADGVLREELFPSHNTSRSVLDGPHIDARTGRRVGQDDRLWFSLTARPLPYAQAYSGNPDGVIFNLDYRALGTIVKAHNKSTF